MFVSYAQNFEDVILWRALKHVEHGFYVDIGAQDPINDSVSRGFYEKGWRGVHVEPTESYASKLRANRPDEEVIQAAIGSGSENLRFFEIPGTGLSTGDSDIAQKHRANGLEVRETEVPQIALAALFEYLGEREVHWLKIDTEGMETEVIESWMPSKARPWIVVVESTLPNSQATTFGEWEPTIISLGYEYAYFDGVSRFYISVEHRDLRDSFGPGPNIFDKFELALTSGYVDVSTLNIGRIALEARVAELQRTQKDAAAELEAQRKKLEARVRAVNEATEQLNREMQAVYASWSWRMTRPLRKANSVVHRISGFPNRSVRLLTEHAALWLQRRPKWRARILRAIRLVPPLERQLVLFMGSRIRITSESVAVVSPNWSMDPDPQILSEWKTILGIASTSYKR